MPPFILPNENKFSFGKIHSGISPRPGRKKRPALNRSGRSTFFIQSPFRYFVPVPDPAPLAWLGAGFRSGQTRDISLQTGRQERAALNRAGGRHSSLLGAGPDLILGLPQS